MKEEFLAFLWKYQYSLSRDLCGVNGERIQIIHPGFINTNSGPDYNEAKIIIDSNQWCGNIEFHLKSSDWVKHKHHHDKMYESVILHVVWEYDDPVFLSSGEELPTLELHNITDQSLLEKYNKLLDNESKVLCDNFLSQVPSIVKTSMLQRTLVERLESKFSFIDDIHVKNNGDWKETAYSCLFSAFGFSLNKEPCLELSSNLKYHILAKHLDSFNQVLSLLMGCSNVLKSEDLKLIINKEYQFLKSKYQLNNKEVEHHQWKYFRVRPSGFPSVRLFQLAKLLFNAKGLRTIFFEKTNARNLMKNINKSVNKSPLFDDLNFNMTLATAEILMINAVLPFQFYYGRKTSNDEMVEMALSGFEELKPEVNKITKKLINSGFSLANAGESQAGIHLLNNYCSKKRCIKCLVGNQILRNK